MTRALMPAVAPGTPDPVRAECTLKGDRGGGSQRVSTSARVRVCDSVTPARPAPAPAGFLRELELLDQPGATAMVHMHSMAMVQRINRGNVDQEVIAWLIHAVQTWSRARGAVSMDRCMRLPPTPGQVRLFERDYWLLKAVEGMEGATLWERCRELSRQLAEFASRGPWRRWRDLQDPPRDATGLQVSLFYVAKSHGGQGLSTKQIHRRLTRDTFSPGNVCGIS